ncbi:hypothetical protein ACHQM5_002852 [Ranunculus cassubicifolius]
MAQEENQRCSNNNSGGCRNSKKPKPKKIPQRGLGVAQLEKIRLEEQQKNEEAAPVAVVRSPPLVFVSLPQYHNHSSPSVPPPKDIRSFKQQPRPNFHGFGQSLTIPQPPPPPRPPSQRIMYPQNHFDPFGQSPTIAPPPAPPSQPLVYGHNDYRNPFGRGASPLGSHSYSPSVLNSCELRYDRDHGSKLNPGLMFQARLHNDLNHNGSSTSPAMQNQLNHIGPSSASMLQNQGFHLHQNQFIKENVSNSSISSGLNLQIEPPSNQSYHSNNNQTPTWPEDDKTIGMKRSLPFSQENPQCSSFPSHHLPFLPLNFGLDERLSSHNNGATMSFERRNLISREGPLGFIAHQPEWRLGLPEKNTGNEEVDTVLTLGLPAACSPTTKAKQPIEFSSSSYHGFLGNPVFREGESGQSQLTYSFFPPKAPQNGHVAGHSGNQRSEITDRVDLNLKL